MDNCIFCKIVKGEAPSTKVYEDSEILAFKNIYPKAPIHFLVIPKEHIEDFTAGEAGILGRVGEVIKKLIKENGLLGKGYRIVVNGGGAAAIPHLHFHILGEIGVEREV